MDGKATNLSSFFIFKILYKDYTLPSHSIKSNIIQHIKWVNYNHMGHCIFPMNITHKGKVAKCREILNIKFRIQNNGHSWEGTRWGRNAQEALVLSVVFFFFSFYGCTSSIWKFSGQGLSLSHGCDNVGSFNPLC